MSDPKLKLENVDKFYGPIGIGVHAVRNVSMNIEKGEITALLGSSGCGKTSTLRMIAGFEETSRGRIIIDGREVHKLSPVKRNVAMAFEGYSLYPTVTVGENIAFALKSARLAAPEITKRVNEIADMLEISDILDRMPNLISGGQQQRASLARALIRDADLYLLDEPMGQLEPQLRTLLRGRIKHFIKERGLTAILVTHDQTEANALADRIAVMEDGVLQQYASPNEIKERPANLFTGTFIGEPPMNVFAVDVTKNASIIEFNLADGDRLSYPARQFRSEVREAILEKGRVVVGVRPYAVHRAKSGLSAKVLTNQWLGDQSHIAAEFAGGTIVLVEHDRTDLKIDEKISVAVTPDDLHIFDPDSTRAISHGGDLAE